MMYELICCEGLPGVAGYEESVVDRGEDLDGLYDERDELDENPMSLTRKRHSIRPTTAAPRRNEGEARRAVA